MADVARPHTPSRKLFKPSNRTPPVKKTLTSANSTPHKLSASKAPSQAGSVTKSFKPSSAPRFVRRVSQASSTHSRLAPDDIVRSTRLAPLTTRTGRSGTQSSILSSGYAASDATGETPIGLVDNDALTPTDTGDRSTDAAPCSNKTSTSDTMSGAAGHLSDHISTAKDTPAEQFQAATSAMWDESSADTITHHDAPDQDSDPTSGGFKGFASKLTGSLRGAASDLTEKAAKATNNLSSPLDLAKYFADQGHSEMSEFVKALAATEEDAEGPQDSATSAKRAADPGKDTGHSSASQVQSATSDDLADVSPNPMEELPRDDALVRASDDTITNGPVGVPDPSAISRGRDFVGDGTGKSLAIGNGPGKAPQAAIGRTPSRKEGDVVSKATQNPSAARNTAANISSNSAKTPPSPGMNGSFSNMGKPARVNRSVEIPLPQPSQAEQTRSRSRMKVPGVDRLPSTDDLASLEDMEDPPEEFLDPNIHSPDMPAANISPIPKISKVAPISSTPPPDLADLAKGLGGNTVDDVGNVVDGIGRVLGHATGDLPSMVGKKVAENGEVYGDSGELIGFVTENFTGQPPAAEPANATPLPGGLKVDTEGNILDGNGNVIGKLHNKLGGQSLSGALVPLGAAAKGDPKTDSKPEQAKEQNDTSKDKKDTGIPADIFLDVKSTPDGIQLTIRIPTVFKQEHRQTTES